MVEATLVTSDFSDQLNSWYTYVLNSDVDKAIQMKQDMSRQLKNLSSQNSPVFLHAKLIELSHALLLKDKQHAAKLLDELAPFEQKLCEKLKFYFYFFNGQYAYQNQEYEVSLNEYQAAKEYIEEIESDFEMAEFHYKIASSYYFLHHSLLSISHLEEAQDLYDASIERNIIRNADCEMLFGLNYLDMKQYGLAEEKFHSALMYSQKVNDSQLRNRVLHNLGFFYAEQGHSEAAIRYLKLLVPDDNYEHSLRAIFLLYREYCRLGNHQEAESCFKIGMKQVMETSNTEYEYKFQLLDVILIQNKIEEKLFFESILYFEDNKYWEDVEEYSKLVAQVYSKANAHEKAVHYYELAFQARNTINQMEALK
ncbi:hypothetical protein [Alkalihalobacillus sp. TS-13]|uniref:tetratricopeptide repeat protein n=1 Tax=Alkalihalobacillus sp. TS-13 TaxID=2842455 RepID=UPI001C8800D3|nr:hypothetical protein [Alkalihalobacillus sp. TS-13]